MANDYNDEEESEDEVKTYLTVEIAKYPFLKNMKVGDEGVCKFKGQILEQGLPETVSMDEDDEEDDEDDEKEEVHSVIKISDLINKKESVRKE